MSFACCVCGIEHVADFHQSRLCDTCRQRFCLAHTPVPNDGTYRTCGRQTTRGWVCIKCDSQPPRCSYPGCNNELVEGEYFPCKACLRPMCGDHLQTAEICEECWAAGRRKPFVDSVQQGKGWNVKP